VELEASEKGDKDLVEQRGKGLNCFCRGGIYSNQEGHPQKGKKGKVRVGGNK